MNEAAETKICPYCAETIKAAAKKCPFCNSRFACCGLLREELSMTIGCLIIFGLIIFALVKITPETEQGGRDFARHRRDLQVSKVNVDLVSSGTSAFNYNVSGLMTNNGEYPWRVREFELIITNSVGVCDVRNQTVDSFVVQPHTEHAFAFHCYSVLTNPVVTARARVADARDGNIEESF